MKKRLKHYTTASLASVLLLSAPVAELVAQQSRTSYFMKNSTVSMQQNPAFRPERGFVSIPVLGMVNPIFSTNGLTFDQIVYPRGNESVLFTDPSVDTNSFLKGLKGDNQINVGVNTQLFGAGWYRGKAFWSFDLSLKTNANLSVPKTLFEFIKRGTGAEGATYNMSDLSLFAESYVEAGVGYSRPINEKLTVGGKLKFLVGAGSVKAQIDQMHAVMNEGQWKITTQGTLNASIKDLKTEPKVDDNGEEYIDDYEIDGGGVAGYGAGIDLGASYRLTDKITLSGALLDLGFIKWGKGVYGVSRGAFEFDGFDLSIDGDNNIDNQLESLTDNLDELIRFREEGQKSRSTLLRPTLNIGGEYELLQNKLTFGLLSSTRFYRPKAYTELTLSTNYRPISWFEGTLSYSFIHSQFKTFGLALNFSPCWINFFVGSDYLLGKVNSECIPVNSSAADVYFGISVPLGNRARK